MQTSRRRHLRYANEQSTHHFWLCVQFRYYGYLFIFYGIFTGYYIVIDGRISTTYHLICIKRSERKLILLPLIFHCISVETVQVRFFLKLGSLQVLPWNLCQLISYFFALNSIYSINLIYKNRQ